MPAKSEAREWLDKLQAGMKYLEDYGHVKLWDYYREMYRCNFDTKTTDSYTYPLIFSQIRSLIPQVYFRNPRVIVTPTQPGWGLQARVVQRVDNIVIKDCKLKKHMKKIILDASLCGNGVLLCGYDSEYGYDHELKAVTEEQVVNPMTGQIEIVKTPLDGTMTHVNEAGELLEYTKDIFPGMPWAKRVKPDFFIVPFGTEDIDDVEWVARAYCRPLQDVKDDRKLSNTDNIKSDGRGIPDHIIDKKMYEEGIANKIGDYVWLWEVRDFKRGKMLILHEGGNKVLYKEKDYTQTDGVPYEILRFNDNPGSFWGIPDVKVLENQQLAINKIKTIEMLHAYSSLRKILARSGTISESEIDKLLSEDLGAVVEVQDNPKESVMTLQPAIPMEFMAIAEEILRDARTTLGFSRNELGEYEKGRKTATEVQAVSQGSQIRTDERRDMLADILENIISRFNDYIFDEQIGWSQNKVIDIVGPDFQRYWVTFTGSQLRGEYRYQIDPESSLPTSTEQRRSEVDYLYRALGTGQNPLINPYEMTKLLLAQFDYIDPDTIIAPPQAAPGMNPDQPINIGELDRMMSQKAQSGELTMNDPRIAQALQKMAGAGNA